jgi:glycosyltransferase involved in cell wall biosynthesis
MVFYTNSGDDSLAVLRVLGPAQKLGVNVIRGVHNSQINVEAVRDGDVILVQRDFPLNLDAYEQVLALARSLGKPVIFDLDDLLFELPENHPDRLRFHFTDALLPMLQAVMEADLVTVATPPLREYLLPINQNIAVIPNYLNDDLWQFNSPLRPDNGEGIIIIGYMGGHSHRPDLLLVLPALLNIAKKYPGEILYQFWGIEPPTELAPYSKVDWCPPGSLLYADFVDYFLTQTADIVIAPLGDNLFNSCKSSIKYLEYGAFGSPGVYSRVQPYSDIITEGEDGFLAATQAEWERYLSNLIESRDLRIRVAQNAQRNIKENWLLSQNAHHQLQVYTDAVNEYSKEERIYPPFYQTVKSLSHQLTEALQFQKRQIDSLKDLLQKNNDHAGSLVDLPVDPIFVIQALQDQVAEQIVSIEALTNQLAAQKSATTTLTAQLGESNHRNLELASQLEEREQEALAYALSRSWRITRPFRNLSRKFHKPGPR